MRYKLEKKLIVLMALISLTFLTGCKTIEYVYVYPDFINPEIQEMPDKTYIDGGFRAVDDGLLISENDGKILSKYIVALKNWGSAGWTWITDYYITELDRLKKEGE